MEKIVDTGLKIDLHIHSKASHAKDGRKVANNTLENIPLLISKLSENGVNICAITDHDVFSYEMYHALKAAENQDNKEQENLQSVQDTSYNETTAGQTFDNPSGADDAAKSTKTTKASGKEGVTYAIQIMASKKKLVAGSTEFKKLTPVARIYDSGFYKYCYGSFSTRQEAALKLPQVKKKFKDAFVVEIKNGKIAGR